MKTKKYPLLITTIISCLIVVVSLFILGFFGMKLGTSLGGGSQFEIAFDDESKAKEYTSSVKEVLKKHGLQTDSVFVEDNFIAGEEKADFTTKCLVVKISNEDVSSKIQSEVKADLAKTLNISENSISSFENLTSSVSNKNVLFVGLALGLIIVGLVIFGWLRYDIFAGISFLISNLHSLILYLSILILSRVELSLLSLSAAIIVTLLMSVALIAMFEKYREQSKLHIDDKLTITERMISCEKQAIKPFALIAIAVAVVAILMFVVPVRPVVFAAINILISLIVSAYTLILIAPAIYVALSEAGDARRKAVLSRNDNVNKAIMKKKRKNSK